MPGCAHRRGTLAGLALASALLALAASAADAPAPAVFAGAASEGMPERILEPGGRGPAPRPDAPRLRMARLDFGSMAAVREAAASGRSAAARLNLFEDAEFDWIVQRAAATAGGYSLSGPLAGVEAGTATLVANGGMVVGSAWTPEAEYRIRTVGRTQIVERVELPRALRCDGPLEAGPAMAEGATPGATPARGVRGTAASAAPDDGSEIDVLVVYTPQARRKAGGHRAMLAEIDHDVAWTNEAYAVSGAAHRVRLVGAVEVDYEEQGQYDDIGHLIRQGDDRMDDVHALRDSHAADVVMLKTTSGGLAIMLTSLDASIFSPSAFATIQVGDPTTFAHELGHLMGVDHARGDDVDSNGNLPFPYSHGYVLPDIRRDGIYPYSTIMESAGGTLPRFSNPSQRFRGVPLGVPGDEPTARLDGPADAVRSMDETRRLVANYRRSATRCRYRLSPPPEVPAAGGTYSLRVEADAGCAWTARAADGFTTVAGDAGGVGDGAVEYRVPANDSWEREVALAVAGGMHVSLQPGARAVKRVCERSTVVREALEAELGAGCADIGAADLAGVVELRLVDASPAPGDFDGLTNLGALVLHLGAGTTLEAGTFDGMAGVVEMRLSGSAVSLQAGAFRGLENLNGLLVHLQARSYDNADHLPPLPPGVFREMPRLRRLTYAEDSRATIAPGLFDGLTGLLHLYVGGTLTHLPAGAFRGMPNLRRLRVRQLFQRGGLPLVLEPGVFDGLSNLERLRLWSLAGVPRGTFEGLSGLTTLWMFNNAFASLEPGAFLGLSSLRYLRVDNDDYYVHNMHRHELPTLPPGLFAGLPGLERLSLVDTGLTELDPHAFDDVPQLWELDLSRNRLAGLPPGAFDSLPNLSRLYLRDNRLAALPPAAFRNLHRLRELQLHGNRLAALPPGLFVGAGSRWPTGIDMLTLHGNPAAPFTLALQPVVASAAWERPARVAVRIAQGAPFALDVGLRTVGGRLEEGPATTVRGAYLSDSLAVRPAGLAPVVVGVAGIPEVPGGAECAELTDAGKWCGSGPVYTGIELAAGRPLVLNGVAPMREFGEPAEIDLSNVFLEFDGSDAAAFAVRVSDPAVATAETAGALLRVSPADHGTATVTVTATAADGRTATRTFAVAVPRQPRFLRGWRLWLLDDGGGGD